MKGRWSSWCSPMPGFLAVALLGCGEPTPPRTDVGYVSIKLVTLGEDLDLDGYVITLDGVDHAAVAPDGSLTLAELSRGRVTIGLSGVAANCFVLAPYPRVVEIVAGRALSVTFQVQCRQAGIHVVVFQSGHDIDEDGFTVTVDGNPGPAITAGAGGVVLTRLAPGPHLIEIGGVASHCAVDGAAVREVTVTLGELTLVPFTLTCQAVTGSVEIEAVTAGEDYDLDGYRVYVDGVGPYALPANGVRPIARLTPGQHHVRLEGLSSNCLLQGAADQSFDVSIGAATPVTFNVTCAPVEFIAFTRGYADLAEITVTTPSGDETTILVQGQDPAWSPDGRSLAFRQVVCAYWNYYCFSTGIAVTRLGTSGVDHLTTNDDGVPAWSPDGGSIAFTRWNGFDTRLHVLDVATREVRSMTIPGFTGSASDPAWSPDGGRLAFTCVAGRFDICVMSADGSEFRRLTNDFADDREPAWSPDGTQIAFTRVANGAGSLRVALIGSDGTGLREIADGEQPAWSPDGTRLVFRGSRVGSTGLAPGLYMVNADGSGLARLTMVATDHGPAWRRLKP